MPEEWRKNNTYIEKHLGKDRKVFNCSGKKDGTVHSVALGYFGRGIHHCRLCGDMVCDTHSQSTIPREFAYSSLQGVPDSVRKKDLKKTMVRCCDRCDKILDIRRLPCNQCNKKFRQYDLIKCANCNLLFCSSSSCLELNFVSIEGADCCLDCGGRYCDISENSPFF